MEAEIKIAVSYKEIKHEIIKLDLPEQALYFCKGKKWEYDTELFAIIPTYIDKSTAYVNYTLLKITKNHQWSTDFIPRNDLKSDYWVDGSNQLRHIAVDIIRKQHFMPWEELSLEEFNKARAILLNWYLQTDLIIK